MDRTSSSPVAPGLAQVFLLERDCGLLCRVMGLYAARGLEVLHQDYAYAAQDVMKLQVRVAGSSDDTAEALRVLVARVATFPGVLAAAHAPVPACRDIVFA